MKADDGKIIEEMHLQDNLFEKDIGMKPTRFGFGEALVELGDKNPNIVVLGADLSGSVKADLFWKKFPERFFQMGIAEQNMSGVATGLALVGKIPYIATYAVFSAGRNWDQIRISACYPKANIKIGGAHAGVSVGPDGATHQALEDIATMRCLPNMVVLVPTDYPQTNKATIASAEIKGPVYLRFGREKVPIITTDDTPFVVGKADVYRDGNDVSVFACGEMVYQALLAANELDKEGISVRVVNNHTVKPIDEDMIVKCAAETGAIVTAEEHQIAGGMGSAVAEIVVEKCPVPMARVGVLDRFGESGSPIELMEEFGLTYKDIMNAVKKVIGMKK